MRLIKVYTQPQHLYTHTHTHKQTHLHTHTRIASYMHTFNLCDWLLNSGSLHCSGGHLPGGGGVGVFTLKLPDGWWAELTHIHSMPLRIHSHIVWILQTLKWKKTSNHVATDTSWRLENSQWKHISSTPTATLRGPCRLSQTSNPLPNQRHSMEPDEVLWCVCVCVCVCMRMCACQCVQAQHAYVHACMHMVWVCQCDHNDVCPRCWVWTTKWGSRDSLLVRAPDSWSKGCEFESQQEWQGNFLLQSRLCVLTLIQCPFHPQVTPVACKRPVILPKVQVAGYA